MASASATAKKPCVKCNKGGGVTTCDGCQQSWCTKHFIEHRQELSQQMDKLGQEHDLLQRDLSQKSSTHPLLSHIDKWEQESIIKIQVAAEAARADLRQAFDRIKNELKVSVATMTNGLQSSLQSDDYTEVDLKRWVDELNELRKRLETPSTMDIVLCNQNASSIRLIKVKDQQQLSPSAHGKPPSRQIPHALQQPVQLVRERFDDTVGRITMSEEGLVATCTHSKFGGSIIRCANRYSSGTHHIRFLIEQKRTSYLFFGIRPSSQALTDSNLTFSTNGWWDLDDPIVNGASTSNFYQSAFKTGDDVTLTLNCDNRQIQLQHHRTNRVVYLPIDLRMCPFPWKILVKLNLKGDCVRIASYSGSNDFLISTPESSSGRF